MTENNSFDPKWPETHFLPWSTWFDPYWPGELGFDQKWRFWPENGLKLIFYPGWHGLTRIDSVDSVLTENDGFDPKTAWNSFFTLVDMVWPVLTRWTRFWPKITVLTRNGLKLIFYSGRHVLTRINSVDSVLTRKLIFYLADMAWPVLTRWNRFLWKDAVDSRKIYFWIFLFLNFFWFL